VLKHLSGPRLAYGLSGCDPTQVLRSRLWTDPIQRMGRIEVVVPREAGGRVRLGTTFSGWALLKCRLRSRGDYPPRKGENLSGQPVCEGYGEWGSGSPTTKPISSRHLHCLTKNQAVRRIST